MTAGEFRRYHHLERAAHPDVADLDHGTVYIFPKIDGTNASMWCDADGVVQCGSRSRMLSVDNDNHGFHAWVNGDELSAMALSVFLKTCRHLTVYGEWLVPHTLKTYREEAWRRFYVFDVYSHEQEAYLPFSQYGDSLSTMEIDIIVPLAIAENPSKDQIQKLVDHNTFLIRDGAGAGEGVVLKNYDWKNKYGHQPWAKVVRNEFKESNLAAFGIPVIKGEKQVEAEIVAELCTEAFVRKTFDRVVLLTAEDSGSTFEGAAHDNYIPREHFIEANRGKIIPRFLGTVYHEFVVEEIWTIVKRFKNPTICFRKLQNLLVIASKKLLPEIF